MQIIFFCYIFIVPGIFVYISSNLALCINVDLSEFCIKLMFFRVNWLNAEPASPSSPALGSALREGLKPGPGPSPTFKARARARLFRARPITSLLQF